MGVGLRVFGTGDQHLSVGENALQFGDERNGAAFALVDGLNAENGDEATIAIKPGEGDKKIAVVGGGIAGLEAARVAAKRGYDVTIYEASDHLGGQIVLAAAPPRKDEIMRSDRKSVV